MLAPPPPDWINLRIFLAAVELGSVTRAASHYGIATSAATKRVQDLETEYGVRLLERSARGVRATAAGEVLARHARTLLDLAARLADDLRALAAGGLGIVRLHATASAIIGHGLAEALAAFATARPGIKVELREETSPAIVRSCLTAWCNPYGTALGLHGVPIAERWARRRLWLVARPAKTLLAPARLLLDHLVRPASGAAKSVQAQLVHHTPPDG
jgi:molybdenum-dependent DNA-binding transcriptional regulator ModE